MLPVGIHGQAVPVAGLTGLLGGALPLAGLHNRAGPLASFCSHPDWMGLQFVLPDEMVLLAGFYMQVKPQAVLHRWVGLLAVV